MWYHAAEIQANGTLQWASSGATYDTGTFPSVAVSGPTIVEVHQGVAGMGHCGTVPAGCQSDGAAQFAVPFSYDNGEAPRVAVAGPTILEVHQAGTGVGPLWYHTAAY